MIYLFENEQPPTYMESVLIINLFQANVPFLYPLKTWENQRFSDAFTGHRSGTLTWNESNFTKKLYHRIAEWTSKDLLKFTSTKHFDVIATLLDFRGR